MQVADPDVVLSPDDMVYLNDLVNAPDDEFDREVAEYVRGNPDLADHAVFRHPQLIERTLESVERTLARNRGLLKNPPPSWRRVYAKQVAAQRLVRALVVQKETLRPLVGMHRDRVRQRTAAETSPRQAAYRRLARMHPRDFSALLREERAKRGAVEKPPPGR